MKKFALLGKNINYSISKKLHEIIGAMFNINLSYEIINCEENELEYYLDKLKRNLYDGFNVTIPYKEKMLGLVDCYPEKVNKIKAINTVSLIGEDIAGYNTDYDGFEALLMLNNIEVKGKNVYVLGSGGAARAIYHVLNDNGANTIIVRRKEDKKIDGFKHVITYEEIDNNKVDIYVNATPVGTYPNILDCILPKRMIEDKQVIDLVYNPKETKFVKNAKFGVGGLTMLIVQAIKAEEIFNNIKIPINIELIRKIESELEK